MNDEPEMGLVGDPERRANDTVHGFIYQFWHTVHAWLDLSADETLFVEGAEDFDIVAKESATATQVKATSANITLRSSDVVEAIKNFWDTQQKNRGRRVQYRFLSTSKKGQEQGAPFGPGVRGLDVWERSVRDHSLVDSLRSFFISENCFEGELKSFIESATVSELVEELISHITWDLDVPESRSVEEAVKRKLVEYGATRHVPSLYAERVASRLLKEVADAAASRQPRRLEYADFAQIFDEETRMNVSIAQHEAGVAALVSLLSGSLSPTGLAFDLRALPQRGAPPLPNIHAPRDEVVQKAKTKLREKHVICFQGSTGMGKTILAALVVQSRPSLVWVPFRGLSPREANLSLRQLARLIDEDRSLNTIVLDDLNFEPDAARGYEDVLGGLLYTVNARGVDIIVTSERVFPASIRRAIGFSDDPTISVPSLSQTEIESFAVSLGCPPEKARPWSLLVEMKTQGHPQLVHAQLLTLARNNWPVVDMNAVIETPEEIAAEQARARMLLAQVLDQEKQLLYRLSFIGGPFRRDHGIAIAELAPNPHASDRGSNL
jgi:hypothetical protein